MALTKKFKETVKARVQQDPEFRKAMLRDYINATIGFEELVKEIDSPSKSLMRMLSAKGNPRADNLFSIISHLQKSTQVHLAVEA